MAHVLVLALGLIFSVFSAVHTAHCQEISSPVAAPDQLGVPPAVAAANKLVQVSLLRIPAGSEASEHDRVTAKTQDLWHCGDQRPFAELLLKLLLIGSFALLLIAKRAQIHLDRLREHWLKVVLLLLLLLLLQVRCSQALRPDDGDAKIFVPSIEFLFHERTGTRLAADRSLPPPPRKLALVFGVTALPQVQPDGSIPPTCEGDVADIRALLSELNFDEIKVLMNPSASQALQAMRRAVATAIRGDQLVVYFCGHGGSFSGAETKRMEEDGLKVWKAKRDDKTEVDGRDEYMEFRDEIVKDDLLYEIFVEGAQPGVNLLIILNVCHSGSMIDLPFQMEVGCEWRLQKLAFPAAALDVPSFYPKTIVSSIAGCRDDEETFFDHGEKRSHFTGNLTQAIRRGARTHGELLNKLNATLKNGTVVTSSLWPFPENRNVFY